MASRLELHCTILFRSSLVERIAPRMYDSKALRRLFSGIDRRISELAKGAFRYSSPPQRYRSYQLFFVDAVSPPSKDIHSEHLNGLQETSRRIR